MPAVCAGKMAHGAFISSVRSKLAHSASLGGIFRFRSDGKIAGHPAPRGIDHKVDQPSTARFIVCLDLCHGNIIDVLSNMARICTARTGVRVAFKETGVKDENRGSFITVSRRILHIGTMSLSRMQRLIFVNRFFYPDHSATSQMLSDLAFYLA